MSNSVRDIIDQQAASRGNRTFLISPETEQHISYSELRSGAREIAAHLQAMGFVKGEKIAFLMNNGAWTAKLFLGVMYSGRVILPLNAVSGHEQLAYVIDHSDCRIIFVEDEFQQKYGDLLEAVSDTIKIVPVSRQDGPQWPAKASDKLTEVIDI
ncbi:MAG: acyl--CoA ligase, partial [Gammaproteobacteria bacterium]|nr:acyl--CoA ligase [Gammaproteobacteria bacterium]